MIPPMALAASTLLVGGTAPGAGSEARATSTEPTRLNRVYEGHVLDGSGLVLPRGRWQVGLIETQYGLFDWLDIGTSPYPWLIGPLLQGFSGNVGMKLGLVGRTVAASIEARFLLLNVERTEDDGARTRVSAYVLPLTAAVSLLPDDAQAYSLAGRLIVAEAFADDTAESEEVTEGAAATNAFQLVASARYRFGRVFGLYARGLVQPWVQNINVDGESRPDSQTRITFQGSFDPGEDDGVRWSVLAGAHLILSNINLRFGMGYGSYFMPAFGLVVPGTFFYPDLDLYIRF